MSGYYRGPSGGGGSSRGDLPYRSGQGGGPRQGGGQGGYQGGSQGGGGSRSSPQGGYQGGGGGRPGGGGGRGGFFGSGRMYQGVQEPLKTVETFENDWIRAKPPTSRPQPGEMATRPAYGTKGANLTVRANYFNLSLEPSTIKFYSYIAKIEPQPKLKRHLPLIWDYILNISKVRQNYGASDKASELVTVGPLGQVPNLEVTIPDGDRDPKTYKIYLTLNEVIDPATILSRLRTVAERGAVDGEAIMLRLMNIIMAAYPGKDSGVATLGRGGSNKFFWIGDRNKQSIDLRGGLECLRGFYASVRLAGGRMLLNLSVNHSAFYKPGAMKDLWEEFQKLFQDDRHLFGRYVKGLRVECEHLKDDDIKGKKIPRVKTIWGVAEDGDGTEEEHKPDINYLGGDAYNVYFYMDGTKISVAEYFKKKYGRTLQKGWPVLNVGSKGKPCYLPMDVMKIPPGRVFRGELGPSQRQSIITFSCRSPGANYDSIIDHGLKMVGGGSASDNIKASGFKISTDMVAVPARYLSPPTVKYKNGRAEIKDGKLGGWNLVGKTFNTCAKITRWVGVHVGVGPAAPSDTLNQFQAFAVGMARCGMSVQGLIKEVIHVRISREPKANIKVIDGLFAKLRDLKIELAVIVLPTSSDRVFDHIKWRGDTKDGIRTLCVAFNKFFPEKGGDNLQYWANNAMKVNLRFGGVNQILDLPASSLIAEGKTMVVGLDVTHPSPTDPDTFPSIASIVASTDKTMGQWPGQVKIQARRMENVEHLSELMKDRLHRWKKDNRAFPENIVIFRDGVSEGQYQMVLTNELAKVKEACKALYTGKQPNITVLVGGKRHNTRFFPVKSGDADSKGNCKPGLVVDRGITRPHLWDFYLQAQAPLQGSARSAHYVVIWDEIFINPGMKRLVGANAADAIQELTHHICYMMGRCTRSISYSTPAFLADRFADRARKYVRAYYFEAFTRGVFRPPPPGDQVTRLANNLAESMVYI